MIKLTKDEIRTIKHWDTNFQADLVKSTEEARGQKIRTVYLISSGLRNKHSSGYPHIQVIGEAGGPDPSKQHYYDLGSYFDSISVDFGRVGLDSIGKNIFRIWPKTFENWIVSDWFSPVSTLHLGNDYPSELSSKESIS